MPLEIEWQRWQKEVRFGIYFKGVLIRFPDVLSARYERKQRLIKISALIIAKM